MCTRRHECYLCNLRHRYSNSSLSIILLQTLKSSGDFPVTLNNKPINDILQFSVITMNTFCFCFFISMNCSGGTTKHVHVKKKLGVTSYNLINSINGCVCVERERAHLQKTKINVLIHPFQKKKLKTRKFTRLYQHLYHNSFWRAGS